MEMINAKVADLVTKYIQALYVLYLRQKQFIQNIKDR